jgi:hypothetical protein
MLRQVIREFLAHGSLHHGLLVEHAPRDVGGRLGPPGAPRQIVGQARRAGHGGDRLGFAEQQQFVQPGLALLPHARPALQEHRVTAGRAERVAREQFAHQPQVFLRAAGRVERHARLVAARQPVDRHVLLVDADRLDVVGEQHVQPQQVFAGKFH